MLSKIIKEKHVITLIALLLTAIAVIIYFYFIRLPVQQVAIGSSLPSISVPNLLNEKKPITNSSLSHHIKLMIFWNTSSLECNEQQDLLKYIASTKLVNLYAIDASDQFEQALAYLKKYGNPFTAVAMDKNNYISLLLDIQKIPTAILIDQHNIIKDRLTGPITPAIWFNHLVPEINQLSHKKTPA